MCIFMHMHIQRCTYLYLNAHTYLFTQSFNFFTACKSNKCSYLYSDIIHVFQVVFYIHWCKINVKRKSTCVFSVSWYQDLSKGTGKGVYKCLCDALLKTDAFSS